MAGVPPQGKSPHKHGRHDESALDHSDTGCRYFDSCLDCPLPRCLFEVSAPEKKRMMRDYRWSLMSARFRELVDGQAMPADEAAIATAVEFGKSKRTVQRAVAETADRERQRGQR